MPKENGKLLLCVDPVRLSKVLMRLVPRGPTLNGILPRLASIRHLILIDESLGYHNLKLDEQSHTLLPFPVCLAGTNAYNYYLGYVPTGNMFQRKIDEPFQRIFNVFGIADEILIAGLNDLGRDHGTTPDKVLRICRKANLKLNKKK